MRKRAWNVVRTMVSRVLGAKEEVMESLASLSMLLLKEDGLLIPCAWMEMGQGTTREVTNEHRM